MKTPSIKRRLFFGHLLAFLLFPWHRRPRSRFSAYMLPAEDLIIRGLPVPVTITASGYVQADIQREEELCAQSLRLRSDPYNVVSYSGGRMLLPKSVSNQLKRHQAE